MSPDSLTPELARVLHYLAKGARLRTQPLRLSNGISVQVSQFCRLARHGYILRNRNLETAGSGPIFELTASGAAALQDHRRQFRADLMQWERTRRNHSKRTKLAAFHARYTK